MDPRIDDPYLWLEDGDSRETREFVARELARTRGTLDALPDRARIRARVGELLAIGTLDTPQVGGDRVFHTRREGRQNQPVLYVREGIDGADTPLVDVNALAADGTIALDWWFPSDEGRLVAFGTSSGGSELSTLHVIDVATATMLADTIERTRAASVAWLPDATGFYYTRYPRPGDVPAGQEVYHRHVFFHRLGTDPATDPRVFGEGREPEDWPSVSISHDGRWLLIAVSRGWTRVDLYLMDLAAGGRLVTIAEGGDAIYGGEVFEGTLYLTTNEDASRYRVFAVDPARPERLAWREIVPESDAVLASAQIIDGRLFARYEENAHSLLRVFERDGTPAADVPLPGLGTVSGVGGDSRRPDAFFSFQSYTVPPTVYHYEMRTGRTREWARVEAPVDLTPYAIAQRWFTSRDGTRVPMFLVHRTDMAADGRNRTLLTGYGGFNISRTPLFQRGLYLWLEEGGVYAEANLRGGSEFGEAWHRAGMLDRKQNVFDDFIAAAEYLVAARITTAERLAIYGGSNGGLLVGAALTQRPDLFRAVVCAVPLLDMLRYHHFQIAKLWIPEYGSPDDPEAYEWLRAYSPYHRVRNGTAYPAVLLVTAERDTRVDPMHARKMAARLQEATASGRPILLRIEPMAGHGVGKPLVKQIEESTDIWSFLLWQTGGAS
jgi:prolyl oligopeptidase